MNGKKARLLRRAAEAHTIGKSKVSYDRKSGIPPHFIENPTVPGLFKRVTPGIPLRLTNDCTRALYQSMKKVAA